MDLKGLKANRENRETDGPGSSMYTGENEAVQTTLRQFMKVIAGIGEQAFRNEKQKPHRLKAALQLFKGDQRS